MKGTKSSAGGVFGPSQERLRLEAELLEAQTKLKDDEKRRSLIELVVVRLNKSASA